MVYQRLLYQVLVFEFIKELNDARAYGVNNPFQAGENIGNVA